MQKRNLLNNFIGMALYGKLSLRYQGSVSCFMDMYNVDGYSTSLKAQIGIYSFIVSLRATI